MEVVVAKRYIKERKAELEKPMNSLNDNKTKKSRTANVAQVIIRRAHIYVDFF